MKIEKNGQLTMLIDDEKERRWLSESKIVVADAQAIADLLADNDYKPTTELLNAVLDSGFDALKEFVKANYIKWADSTKTPVYLREDGAIKAVESIPPKLEQQLSDLLFNYHLHKKDVPMPKQLTVRLNKVVVYDGQPELFRRPISEQDCADAATISEVCKKLSGLTDRLNVGLLIKNMFPENLEPRPSDTDSVLLEFENAWIRKPQKQ